MEKFNPAAFPYELPERFGNITAAKLEAPGLYYISTFVEFEAYAHPLEFYVAEKDCCFLSPSVCAYGKHIKELPELLFFAIGSTTDGHELVEYELCKYRIGANQLAPEMQALSEMAAEIADSYPNYFGDYPFPLYTPWGEALRNKKLSNGVFWIETVHGIHILAVCYPKWSCDLSAEIVEKGLLNPGAAKGKASFDSYLFFKEDVACLALFELWPVYKSLHSSVNYKALMNAIWKLQPDFAVTYNLHEQFGLNDSMSLLIQALGGSCKLHSSPDHVISMDSEAGYDYIKMDDTPCMCPGHSS